METTKNKLTKNEMQFFNELSKYLETKLYFFGSIQRNDYFPGYSDIDIDIFTENESSIITKLQHFLQVKSSSFKKFAWRLNYNNKLVFGNKIMYKNKDYGFKIEFSIYNENVKDEILYEHIRKTKLPFYVSWVLILLKFFYYKLNLISKDNFRYFKNKLLTYWIGIPDEDFVVFEYKK